MFNKKAFCCRYRTNTEDEQIKRLKSYEQGKQQKFNNKLKRHTGEEEDGTD